MKKSFLGRDIISSDDSKEIFAIKKSWNNFVNIFWIIFLVKLLSKASASVESMDLAIILFALQILAIIMMVILMGYYSYKFSGKKSYFLFGFLGFFWFLVIGIFLGFYQVMGLKNKKLKEIESEKLT